MDVVSCVFGSPKFLELQSVPRGSVFLIMSAVINPGNFDIAASTPPLKGLRQLSKHPLFRNGPSQPRIACPGWRLEEGRCGRAQFRGEDPISEACLVTGRRLVLTARELESEHGDHGRSHPRHSGTCIQRERRERGADKVPRAGQIFPKSILEQANQGA